MLGNKTKRFFSDQLFTVMSVSQPLWSRLKYRPLILSLHTFTKYYFQLMLGLKKNKQRLIILTSVVAVTVIMVYG